LTPSCTPPCQSPEQHHHTHRPFSRSARNAPRTPRTATHPQQDRAVRTRITSEPTGSACFFERKLCNVPRWPPALNLFFTL